MRIRDRSFAVLAACWLGLAIFGALSGSEPWMVLGWSILALGGAWRATQEPRNPPPRTYVPGRGFSPGPDDYRNTPLLERWKQRRQDRAAG